MLHKMLTSVYAPAKHAATSLISHYTVHSLFIEKIFPLLLSQFVQQRELSYANLTISHLNQPRNMLHVQYKPRVDVAT